MPAGPNAKPRRRRWLAVAEQDHAAAVAGIDYRDLAAMGPESRDDPEPGAVLRLSGGGGPPVNDGYGYGPREATSADAAAAAIAAEAIPEGDPRERQAWDLMFDTTANYHRGMQREREAAAPGDTVDEAQAGRAMG